MSDEIDFELGGPIYMVEIYHQQPNQSCAIWGRVLNAESEEDARDKAAQIFVSEGLDWTYITEVHTSELKTLEGGENGG